MTHTRGLARPAVVRIRPALCVGDWAYTHRVSCCERQHKRIQGLASRAVGHTGRGFHTDERALVCSRSVVASGGTHLPMCGGEQVHARSHRRSLITSGGTHRPECVQGRTCAPEVSCSERWDRNARGLVSRAAQHISGANCGHEREHLQGFSSGAVGNLGGIMCRQARVPEVCFDDRYGIHTRGPES